MQIIRHRVNTLAELADLSPEYGAEIDLRTRGSAIVLEHDPFRDGDAFEAFAARWAAGGYRGPLVLNPKEDGLETLAAEILAAHGIENYFLVDVSPPTMVRLAYRDGFARFAVRVSEYESVASTQPFARRAQWVWVDCFTGAPPALADLQALRAFFKVCLVSPELHRHAPETIAAFGGLRGNYDAVCTKHPHLWL